MLDKAIAPRVTLPSTPDRRPAIGLAQTPTLLGAGRGVG